MNKKIAQSFAELQAVLANRIADAITESLYLEVTESSLDQIRKSLDNIIDDNFRRLKGELK